MPLLQLCLVLVVVGVVLWAVNAHVPMAASIKAILNAVVVIAVVVWLLQRTGMFARLSSVRIGH